MMNVLDEQDRRAIIEFVNQLEHCFPANLYGIVLYGSKARGEATAESDLDLLIILDKRNRQNRVQVNKVASRISVAFDVLLLPHVVSWEQWQKMADAPYSFYREVFKDGLPVYGESSFFAPLLHHDVAPLVPIMANA
jgi:uncharacterized protein